MNCLRLIVSSIAIPVPIKHGCTVLCKHLFFAFLLLSIPAFSFAQLTGGTISTTKCQIWDAPHLVVQTAAITGEDGFEAITYTWERSQDITFLSGVQTVGGNTTNLNDGTDLTGTWYYRRRVDNDGNTAYSNTVVVVMMPSATLTGTTAVCENAASPTLTVTGTGGTAPYTITYTINGGSAVTAATDITGNLTILAPTNVAGTFTYSLTSIVDVNSLSETCTNTTFTSGTATVTVNTLPTATISANTLTACLNSTAPTVTITGAGGTAPFTFTYTINGGSNLTVTSTGATATITPPVSTAGTFTYQLVSVQESSPTACVNAQTSSVTIVVNELPTLTLIDPALPSICYGSSFFNVTLTYSNTPTEYKLDWSPSALADGFTNVAYAANNFTSGAPLTVAVPTATAQVTTYTGTLTVRNAITGCESDPGTAPFTINPLPTLGPITGISPVCVGSTLNLSNSLSGGTWSVNNANTTIGNLSGLLTGVAAGSSIVTYSVTNGSGCSSLTTTTVTVNALPVLGTITGVSPVCVGSTLNLSNSFNGGVWTIDNANATIGSLTGLLTGSAAGTSIVTYSVTDGNSCTSITTTTVTINALPILGTITGVNPVCVGSTLNLSNSLNNGVWTIDNANATIGSLTGLLTGSAAGTSIVTYSVTDGNSCTSITTTTVTINALPILGTITGVNPVCVGSTLNLSNSLNNGVWTIDNANATIGSLTGLLTGSAAGTSIVTYSVTDGNSCTSITTTTVTINALPILGTITGVSPVCVGSTLNLSNSLNNGVWTIDNANATIGSLTGLLTGSAAGTSIVTYSVTDVNSCTSITSTTVTINALPILGTITGVSPVCVGSTLNLSNSFNGGIWTIDNANATIGSLTGLLTGSAAGTSIVTYSVTDVNSCTSITTTTVTINALPILGTITGVSPVCVGSTLNLSNSLNNGVWTIDNANATIGSLTGLLTGSAAGTSIVTYSVTDVNSCTSITTTTITINSLPTPTINASGPLTFCTGGSVNLTASGGNIYAWSNGTNVALTNITTSGTYTVTVTDVNSCVNQTSTTVVVNALPTPTINASGPLTFCAGGSVNLTASGGNIYAWSNGTNVALTNITTSGTYTVTVTDVNSCVNQTSTTVVVNALPTPTINASGPLTFCTGGSVNLTASGGNIYAWSNGTNAALTNITTSGTYTVTVTDVNSCVNQTSTTVIVNALPTPTINASGPLTFCTGGSVNLTASGGNIYAWSNGTNVALTNITTSGTYTVTVTDGNSCVNQTSTTVLVNALPTPTINASGPLTFCTGGSVNLTASGGNIYAWSNGTNVALTNITTSGTYTVTVTDGNSCVNQTSTTVIVNALPTPTISASGPLTFCVGGSVNLTANGGNSYAWSNGTNVALTNITTSGTYTVTVTDGNSCVNQTSTTVIVNALPTPTINASGPLTFCAGGSVNLTANGGNSYAWSNGTNAAITNITTSGVYSVTVTDINSCTNITSTTVTVNALPTVNPITGLNAVCIGSTINLSSTTSGGIWSVNNANAAINASGVLTGQAAGSTTVSYVVTDGNNCTTTLTANKTIHALPTVAAISGPNAVCVGSNITLTNTTLGGQWLVNNANASIDGSGVLTAQSAGATTVFYIVTDGNNCSTTVNASKTIHALPTIDAITGANAVCIGSNITLANNTPGGVWSVNNANATINGSGVLFGQIAGNTTVSYTVTDGNNCTANVSVGKTVHALPIVPAIAGSNAVCVGSNTTLSNTAIGGVWSVNNANASINASGMLSGQTAGTTTVSYTVTDANGCVSTITADKTIHALPTVAPITGSAAVCVGSTILLSNSTSGGIWSVNNTNATINGSGSLTGQIAGNTIVSYAVTDANNCTTIVTSTRTVHSLPIATITAAGATTFCAGNSVTLNANTGTGLSYLWTGGGTGNSQVYNATGNYVVTVTDGNGCSATSNATAITVNTLPVATISTTGATTFCAGGSVTLNANTGTGLSYLWTGGGTGNSKVYTASGNYAVTVTDVNGCSATSTPTAVIVNALPVATITAASATTFCAGGSVTLNANTGTGLSYLWTGGGTGASKVYTASGSYAVTITDANGCSNTSSSVPVTVNPLPVATVTANGPTTVCAGNAVTLNAPGGTGYNYSWTGGGNTPTREYSAPGNYAVQITDANGCTSTSSAIAVTVNPLPTLTVNNPAAICSPATVNLTNADITAGSSSGLNLTYWLNVANTIPLTTASAIGTSGTYYIRATHPTTGCFTTRAVVVNVQPQASIQINTPAAICAPATVNLTAPAITNGSETGLIYSYFTDAAATNTLVNANAINASGTYYIKGVPQSGCSAIVPVTVTINPSPTLIINTPAAICAPATIDLTAAAVTNGSASGLSFAYFSNAALTSSLTNANAVNVSGTYYIRATNASSCTIASPVQVQINPLPQGVLQTPSIPYICENGSRTLTASGASSYQWLLDQQPINGATTSTYQATVAGNYAVRFISSEACSALSSNSIRLDLVTEPEVKFMLTNVCAGVTTSFNNTSITSTSGGINWLWDFGDGTTSNQFSTTHIYTSAGDYLVKLTATSPVCTSFNKEATATYRVEQATPAIRYPEIEVLNNVPVTITARAIGNNYLWRPATGANNSRIAAPTFRVNSTTEYTVAITNNIGCTTVDTVLVKVIQGEDILVPQGFTPNADGNNDRLYPILVGMRQLNYFRVFNRWGNMIFTTKDASEQSGWNGVYLGVAQPTGAYTWVAEAIDLQGRVVRRSGTVLLLK